MLVINKNIKRLFDQKFGADAETFIREEIDDTDCFYWIFSDNNGQCSDMYCGKKEDYLNKQTELSPCRKYEILMFLSDYMKVCITNNNTTYKTKEQLRGLMYSHFNSEID